MPNWCWTQFTVKSNEKELKALENAIEDIKKAEGIENGFGDLWLGNVLKFLGVPEEDIASGKYYCRGDISYHDMSGDQFIIGTTTAWAPMPLPVTMLCEKYAPSAEILYISEESGCGLFVSNDPDIAGKYLLDVWDNNGLPKEIADIEYEYYSADQLKDIFEPLVGPNRGISALVQEVWDRYGDRLSINRFDYCDLAEL